MYKKVGETIEYISYNFTGIKKKYGIYLFYHFPEFFMSIFVLLTCSFN